MTAPDLSPPPAAMAAAAAGAPEVKEDGDPLLVTRAVCHALTNIANGDPTCKQAVVAAGGARLLATALKQAKETRAREPAGTAGVLQAWTMTNVCVGGLANVAGGDASCVKALVESGAVVLLVEITNDMAKEVAAAAHSGAGWGPVRLGDACLAFANLACERSIGAPAVVDAGGIAAVAAAMKACGQWDPKVREWTAATISNLTASESDEIREGVLDGGGARVAATILKACDPTEHRALKFAAAVWTGLGRDEESREACARAGLVEALSAALFETLQASETGTQPSAAGFAAEACRAFATFAFGDNGDRARLREGGKVARALTCAVERFPMSAEVQEMGRHLLTVI